jgi:hypothetical protein
MSAGIAAKNGRLIRARKSADGFVSVIFSLFPVTTTPEALVALPSVTSAAPTMSLMNATEGDCIVFWRLRLIA